MTTMTTAATTTTTAEGRLRTVLLEDGIVTAGVGIATVLAAGPLADELPGNTLLFRLLGAVFVLAGIDVALTSRWTGRRLRLAGTVVGELALAVAVGGTALVTFTTPSAPVAAAVVAVAAVSAVFGVVELRLARQLEGLSRITALGAASGR
jgi:predicted membrane-bound spermidine synthase